MAAGRGSGNKRALSHGTSKSSSEQTNGSESLPTQAPTPAADSSVEGGPPPAKRPKLKLNVKPKPPSPADTIAASRPRRTLKQNTRYSDSIDLAAESKPAPAKKSAPIPASPALSSDLSSLSSAPPSPLSERSSSPFEDPIPPAEDEYGNDFMSFYVAGGNEAEQPVTKTKTRRKSKVEPAKKSPQAAKTVEESQEAAGSLAPPRLRKPSQSHTPQQQQAQISQEPRNQALPPQVPPQQHHHHHRPPQSGQSIRPPNVPPSYPLAPPAPLPRPIPQPPPVVNFLELPYDPKPLQPDTVRVMVQKLEALSNALTNFGGVPAMPTTPPAAEPPQPVKLAKPAKTAKPSQAVKSGNAIDDLLGVFADVDSSDEEEDAEVVDPLAYVLSNGGVPDGPLSYGIQFIQNALRSWAQQRVNHSVTQQFQAQQSQQQMHGQQMQQQQKRGPGRPRRYNEPVDPLPNMGAIIHFDMSTTPEGLAIRAFQTVLDSGCLTVNGILPYPLARALRRLYMQIDHLINQGTKDNNNWRCMSYGAQISAHKVRLDKFHEDRIKAQQQQNSQPHGLAQNVVQSQMTRDQLEHAHAVDLERKRSLQHAAQQPYISQQHLHPLQLGVPTAGIAHAPSPSNTSSSMPPPALATTPPVTVDNVGIAREQAGSSKEGDFGSPIVLDSDTNADPPESVPADMRNAASLDAARVAREPPSGAASASASPAPSMQGVMAPSNFPHQGAVVIDQ